MAGAKSHSWKILAMGRGAGTEVKVEKYLQELGCKIDKVIGVDNDKASDDKVIELLKSNDWDGVSVGEYVLFFQMIYRYSSRWCT